MADHRQTKSDQWIFIRGLGREARHWLDFPSHFQEALNIENVLCVDLPGCGAKHKERSPSSIKKISDQIYPELERALSQDHKTYLLGISMGGMVVLDLLQRYSKHFAGGVLVNTSVGGVSPPWQRIRWPGMARVFLNALIDPVVGRERAMLELSSNNSDDHSRNLDLWLKIQQSHPVAVRNFLTQLRAASAFRPSLEKPEAPILLLTSETDRLVNPLCSKALAKKWQVPLIAHPKAGHDLFLDDGQWVIRQIKENF